MHYSCFAERKGEGMEKTGVDVVRNSEGRVVSRVECRDRALPVSREWKKVLKKAKLREKGDRR